MTETSRTALVLCLLSLTLLSGTHSAAAGDSEVVVTVGNARLTRAEVERRLDAVPAIQLETFGKTPQEIRRNFLDRVLVPELLYAEEAVRQRMPDRPPVRDRLRELLRQALENQLHDELAKKNSSGADVKAYFEANRARFDTPRRIRIWRILVSDQGMAQSIIKESQGALGPEKWRKFAREHSKDKATHMRDGDLGFVRPDGSTDVPSVRVEPGLFEAANKVKDGEIVAAPVPERELWAVVWRRGNMPAVTRTLAQEQRSIEQMLTHKKLGEIRDKLVAELRAKYVRDVNQAPLEYLTVDAFGDVAARQKPGVLPRQRAHAQPEKTDRGLR